MENGDPLMTRLATRHPHGWWLRRPWAALTLVLLLCMAVPAQAGGAVALLVEGAGGDAIAARLREGVAASVRVIPSPDLDAALAQQGVKDVAWWMHNTPHRKAFLGKLHRAAEALRVDALVVGAVSPGRPPAEPRVHLLVLRASREQPVAEEVIAFGHSDAGVTRARALIAPTIAELAGDGASVGASAAPNLGVAKPAKLAADAQQEPTPPLAANAQPGAAKTPTTALLTAFLALDAGGRQFHYNERITNANLRPYDLPGGALLPVTPGVAAMLEMYPLASAGAGALRDVGVAGELRANLAKADVGGTSLSSTWYSWELALRARFHCGPRGASPIVGAQLGLGQMVFGFKDPGTWEPLLPAVNYHHLRIAVDTRVPVGPVAVLAGVAYRKLLQTTAPDGSSVPAAGSLGEHFPHASIGGLDADAGVALPLGPVWEARLLISYVRYWAALHPEVGATYVAGGALEQMIHADLGIAASF